MRNGILTFNSTIFSLFISLVVHRDQWLKWDDLGKDNSVKVFYNDHELSMCIKYEIMTQYQSVREAVLSSLDLTHNLQ